MNCRPDACSLDFSSKDKRLKQLRAFTATATSHFRRTGERRWTFTADARTDLEAWVAAESKCCPSLNFDITEDEGELSVRVIGAEALIGELDRPESKTALWAGVGFTGVVGLLSCLLPVALGAAAVWLEGAGILLILAALAAVGLAAWRRRTRASA